MVVAGVPRPRPSTPPPARVEEPLPELPPAPVEPVDDVIPASEAGFPPRDLNAPMNAERWESTQLLHQLWRTLAARSYEERQASDGTFYAVLKRNARTRPLLSDDGAMQVINLIRSAVNNVVALSNISEKEARMLWRSRMDSVAALLVKKEGEWGCETVSTKEEIMTTIKALEYAQFMRPVAGHEASMAVTAIQRQYGVVDQTTRDNSRGWNVFKRKEEARP